MEMTLKESARIMNESKGDLNALIQNKELHDYMYRSQELGREVLVKLTDDEQIAAVNLIQAFVATDLITDGNLEMAMIMLANSDEFAGMMAIALKTAVGLAIMEEWR